MVDVESSIVIDRPVEDVFAYVTDASKEPTWHTDVVEARQTSGGPIDAGTTFHYRFRPFMGVAEGEAEVVRFERNRIEVLRAESGPRPMTSTITYRFEPTEGGTRFTRHVQIQPSGAMRLLQPLMRLKGRKLNSGYLSNLKRILEQP